MHLLCLSHVPALMDQKRTPPKKAKEEGGEGKAKIEGEGQGDRFIFLNPGGRARQGLVRGRTGGSDVPILARPLDPGRAVESLVRVVTHELLIFILVHGEVFKRNLVAQQATDTTEPAHKLVAFR